MKKITFVALAALTITACSSGPEFEVNGDISGADGKMLYLEASGLEGIVPLDSVKLKGEGTFKFKQPRRITRVLSLAGRQQSHQLFCGFYRNATDQRSIR